MAVCRCNSLEMVTRHTSHIAPPSASLGCLPCALLPLALCCKNITPFVFSVSRLPPAAPACMHACTRRCSRGNVQPSYSQHMQPTAAAGNAQPALAQICVACAATCLDVNPPNFPTIYLCEQPNASCGVRAAKRFMRALQHTAAPAAGARAPRQLRFELLNMQCS